TLALLALTVATAAIKVVPLDMAPDSFDDRYRGCRGDMLRALPALNSSEFQQNPNFASAWALAMDEWRVQTSPGSPLTPAQAMALLAYTAPMPLHRAFNAAVRAAGRSRQEYRDGFPFKALHFLLTDALGTLRDAQGPRCHRVFRGVRGVRFRARRGDTVRFGHFASASLCENVACDFGTDTTFNVTTCQGVAIREFSFFPDEDEVLIPPFETFEVTNVTNVTMAGDKVQIWLHSTGTFSKYNCEWLRGDTVGTSW
ncbi:NAR1 ribosyltransferase, partial [Pomatostomus ruficeps]|nr:NAR1 ribosyltransferase [Pomatostomus ruficeps]